VPAAFLPLIDGQNGVEGDIMWIRIRKRPRACSAEHCSGRQRHLQEWVLEKERSIPTDQTQLWKPWRAHLHRTFNQH